MPCADIILEIEIYKVRRKAMKVKVHRGSGKALLILLVLVVVCALFFSLLKVWEIRDGTLETTDDMPTDHRINVNGVWYVPRQGIETFLLMGVDKYEEETGGESYNNTQRTDFLMLMIMDKSTGTCQAIHLNRDTMAEIPVLDVRGEYAGTEIGQLALAHTYGDGGVRSCRNTVEAVSDLLYGVRVDHFISFTMDAVPVINDLAGGVTVTVLQDLTSISPSWTQGAVVTLKGDEALSYVRTRQGLENSSNLTRMERQRQYLNGLRACLAEKMENNDSFLMNLMKKINPYFTSDCTVNQLSRMYERWSTVEEIDIREIPGEAVEGEIFMEYYVDDEALKNLVTELFYVPLEP